MCTRGGKGTKRLLITFQYEFNRKFIVAERMLRMQMRATQPNSDLKTLAKMWEHAERGVVTERMQRMQMRATQPNSELKALAKMWEHAERGVVMK